MRAVRLAAERLVAAEVEVVGVGMADRPHAGRAGEFEDIALWRRQLLDHARHQPDAVHLADDGVFGDADAAADLGRRHPLLPQFDEARDALRRPGWLDDLRRLGRFHARLKRPGPVHPNSPIYRGWTLFPHKIK